MKLLYIQILKDFSELKKRNEKSYIFLFLIGSRSLCWLNINITDIIFPPEIGNGFISNTIESILHSISPVATSKNVVQEIGYVIFVVFNSCRRVEWFLSFILLLKEMIEIEGF